MAPEVEKLLLRNEKEINSAVNLEDCSGEAGLLSVTARAACTARSLKGSCVLSLPAPPLVCGSTDRKPDALAPSWVPSAVAGKVGICHQIREICSEFSPGRNLSAKNIPFPLVFLVVLLKSV